MASANESLSTVLTTDAVVSIRAGYPNTRPANVPDVPPEQLPRPSAQSTIAQPQASGASGAGNGQADSSQ